MGRGGSESKKICTLAKAYPTSIAVHDGQGLVEFAGAVDIAVNAPNIYIQEVVRASWRIDTRSWSRQCRWAKTASASLGRTG